MEYLGMLIMTPQAYALWSSTTADGKRIASYIFSFHVNAVSFPTYELITGYRQHIIDNQNIFGFAFINTMHLTAADLKRCPHTMLYVLNGNIANSIYDLLIYLSNDY